MYRISLFEELSKTPWDNVFKYTYSPGTLQLEKYKDWCKENVGPMDWVYYGLHQKTPCNLLFRHQDDLLAFKLTFGL